MTKIYDKVALIGLGLIGSSIAWASKRADASGEIVGYSRSAETRARAIELGFCDRVAESAAEAARDADRVRVSWFAVSALRLGGRLGLRLGHGTGGTIAERAASS